MLNRYLIIIFVIAAVFRFTGVNWDQGQHLHPDERFITMVGTALEWPDTFSEYLDTSASSLNPHNRGFGFYVYGTWPVIVVKWVAGLLKMDTYEGLVLVGRVISAVFDMATLVMITFMARKLFSEKAGNWTALFYAAAVLPIQLAHYFATDTFAVFCVVLSLGVLFELIQKPTALKGGVLGLAFGLALAAKVSSVVVLPTMVVGFILSLIVNRRNWRTVVASGVIFGLVAYLAIRFTMPYLFADSRIISWHLNPKVVANLTELKSYENPEGYFPPATMWVHAPDYLFPLENMALWGWGIPLFVVGVIAIFIIPISSRKKSAFLISFTVLSIFAYQGGQYAKPMRYFYVLYPLMAILSGVLVEKLINRFGKLKLLLMPIVVVVVLIWPTSFMAVFTTPHSRVLASEWIYNNIPTGSSVSCEHWDDCLPLNLAGFPGNGAYKGIEFTMFYPDYSDEKWQDLILKLGITDYIILSSNRVYGSTVTVPEKYPVNGRYYAALFSGRLGFKKVAEFTSRPRILWPKTTCLTPWRVSYGFLARASQGCTEGFLSFVDDYSDESFTVYDHPKVLIFKKMQVVNYQEVLGISR